MNITILAFTFLTINAMAQSNQPIAQTTIDNSNGLERPLTQQLFQSNLNGQQVGFSEYIWNVKQQKWTLKRRQEKEFDHGNEAVVKGWSWKRYPDSLQYYSLRSQTYNSLQQLIFSSWFSQNAYDNGETHSGEGKTTYTYNSNGCKVKEETDLFDDTIFERKTSTTYKVNVNCQILESLYKSNLFVSSAPQVLNRYEYDNGQLSREVGYTIQTDTSLFFEKIFSYNEKGQIILTEENGRFRTYTDYSPDGKAIHYLAEYLPDNDTTWTPATESFYFFIGDLLEKLENYSNWNPSGKFWQYVSRKVNYFDNVGRIDSSASTQHIVTQDGSTLISNERHQNSRRCDGLETETAITRTSAYDVPVKFTTYTTYAKPADCEPLIIDPLVIFPNPTQGWTSILLSAPAQNVIVRIFADNGQLERSYSFSNGINPILLDLSDLSSGIHIVQVSYGTATASSNIIIQ